MSSESSKSGSSESNQKIALNERIAKVRQIASVKLAHFSQLDGNDCKEVYLFEKEHFVGIRFSLGAFGAKWLLTESAVAVFREGQKLMTFDIDEQNQSKAA